MVALKAIKGGRSGSLVEKLHQRNPEPVVSDYGMVTTSSPKIPVNPFDGFVADVQVSVNAPSVTGIFDLIESDGTVVDSLKISDNGTLRVFVQEPRTAKTFFVQAQTGGTTFKVKVYILRHRITGVV